MPTQCSRARTHPGRTVAKILLIQWAFLAIGFSFHYVFELNTKYINRIITNLFGDMRRLQRLETVECDDFDIRTIYVRTSYLTVKMSKHCGALISHPYVNRFT